MVSKRLLASCHNANDTLKYICKKCLPLNILRIYSTGYAMGFGFDMLFRLPIGIS